MADTCGPFTLEQLDLFGDLDSLAFSLDSAVWSSADTCILDNTANVSCQGNVFADGTATLDSEVGVSGSASVISSVNRIREPVFRSPKTLTVSGTLTTSTAQKKFGSGSMYSASQLNKLDIQPYGDFSGFGDADAEWTIEVWFYQTATNSASLLEIRNASGLRLLHCYAGSHPASGNLCLYLTWNDVVTYNQNTTGTPTFSLNTWNHLVLRKQANKAPQFIVNGTVFPSTPVNYSGTARDWSTINNVKSIGWATIGIALAGYADELRISSVDRYSTYTTPTAAFINDLDTMLLVHGDTDISDDYKGGQAVASGFADLISGSNIVIGVSGSILGDGELASSVNVIKQNIVDFSGYGSLTGLLGVAYDAQASISGDGVLVVNATQIPRTFVFFAATSRLTAIPYRIGEEWSQVGDEANTWTTVSPEANVWTIKPSGTNTWLQQG